MNIINKLLIRKNQFELKIDSYFYDNKSNKIILIIRLRNKRYIQKMFLDDIINDSVILNNLHPIDVCLIGVIYTHLTELKNESLIIKAPEFIELLKITPCLKILETTYNDNNEEEFIISPLFYNKKLKVTAEDIYKKIYLFNGINSNDALQIGCALKQLPTNTLLHVENKLIFTTGIYFIFLVISSFLVNIKIDFVNGLSFSIDIIFLPIILIMQEIMLKSKIKFLLLFASQILTWLFYLYYGFIVWLPIKQSDVNGYMFNKLYYNNISQTFFYLISLMVISFLQVYMLKNDKQKIFFPIVLTSCFFLSSTILQVTTGCTRYMLQDYIYFFIALSVFYIVIIYSNRIKTIFN